MKLTSRILLGAASLLAGAGNLAQADMGFRNDGSGIFPDAKPPLHWSATSNVVWSTKLKFSNASPILLGDKVITCEEPDVLLAFRFDDGRLLWAATNDCFATLPPAEADASRENQKKADALDKQLGAATKKMQAAEELAKAQTNNVEAKASLDTARQEADALRKQLEPLLKYRLPNTYYINGYTTPTPVTDGRNIYVVSGFGAVAGYSPEGQRLWTRMLPVRPHNSNWGHSASPRLAEGLLLVHFGNRLFALDALTGADKWTVDANSGWGSPCVEKVDGVTMVITPRGDFFSMADGRKLAGGCFSFPWNGPIAKDGVVYRFDDNGAKSDGAAAYPIKFDGAQKPAPLWSTKVPTDRYYATAVLFDGLLYNVTQHGTLIVLDAKEGTKVYEQALGIGGGKATVYPSPALAGGWLYVSCDNGMTVVVKAGRTYEELARNQLPAFRSCPAFFGDSMLIRTTSGLMRIAQPK